MEYTCLDDKYYKITCKGIKKKKSYTYDKQTNTYVYNNTNKTEFYNIQNVHKFVNCGFYIWNVKIPKNALYGLNLGIGKTNQMVLSDCENLEDFIIKNGLYETVKKKSYLSEKFVGIEFELNDNILIEFPRMIEKIFPPNIESAKKYLFICDTKHSDEWIYKQALIKATSINPKVIEYITKPPRDIIMNVLCHDGLCLQYIQNQSPKMCEVAMENNPDAFIYVKEHRLEMCYKALEHNLNYYKYVPKRFKKDCRKYCDNIRDKLKEKRKRLKMEQEDSLRRNKLMTQVMLRGAQDVYLCSSNDTFFKTSYYRRI